MVDPNAPEPTGWVPDGIFAGLVGAAVIALFFFAVDVAAGRPFWTPHALGSALFLSEPLPSPSPKPVIVTGYTVLHAGVFVSVGLIVAFALQNSRRRHGPGMGAVATIALFAGFQLMFLVFAGLLAHDVAIDLAGWKVAAANALAALAMAATLVWSPGWARRPGSGGAFTGGPRPVPRP